MFDKVPVVLNNFNVELRSGIDYICTQQTTYNESIGDELKHKFQYPLFHEKGRIGVLMKGLFGYNGNTSLIEFIAWLSSIMGLLYVWNRIRKVN